jgi:hypothetical protein
VTAARPSGRLWFARCRRGVTCSRWRAATCRRAGAGGATSCGAHRASKPTGRRGGRRLWLPRHRHLHPTHGMMSPVSRGAGPGCRGGASGGSCLRAPAKKRRKAPRVEEARPPVVPQAGAGATATVTAVAGVWVSHSDEEAAAAPSRRCRPPVGPAPHAAADGSATAADSRLVDRQHRQQIRDRWGP